MLKHYTLTLTGAAQALSDVLAEPVRDQDKHKPLRGLSLQPDPANTGPVYVGAAGVSATDYGVRLPAPVSSEPSAPWQPPVDAGAQGVHTLGGIYVIGTENEKLHLLVVPFE